MFSRSPDSPTESAKTPKPALAVAGKPASGTPSIIAPDVRIVGNVFTNGEVQLDGTVEGDIRAAALTLGETGAVKGTIAADSVTIKGTVEGQIRGRSVRVEKTAKVRGDLCHEIVSVEAGAIVEGNFSHTTNPLEERRPQDERRHHEERRQVEERRVQPVAEVPPAAAEAKAANKDSAA